MCHCDADGPSFTNETSPKARKQYKCSECRRVIAVGEVYHKTTGLWDGDLCTFRWCSHCSAAVEILTTKAHEYNANRDRRRDEEACVCWVYGDIWTEVSDSDVKDRETVRLQISARRKWTVRRGPHKGQLMRVPQVPAQLVLPMGDDA